MRHILISFFTLLIMLSSVNAQQSDTLNTIPADTWILSQINSFYRLRPNTSLKDIREKLEIGFRKKDLGGDGISQQDYDLEDQVMQAMMRSKAISRWARHDLNGDGHVSRDEYLVLHSRKAPKTLRYGRERVATTAEQRTALAKKSVDKEMKVDKNEDGSVSLQEVIAASNKTIQKNYLFAPRYTTLRRIPDSFDSNQDGKITLSEFTTVTNRLLKRLDADYNGTLDREEMKYFNQLRYRANQKMRRVMLPRLQRR